MNRRSLLLVSTSYPEAGDGSEAAGAFVADLAAELAKRMPVRVLAPGRTAGSEVEVGGIRVRRYAGPGRPLSLLSPANPLHWPAILSTLASLRRETFAIAADGGVAHTLALWVLPSGWAAAALQRKAGVPYSVWALGSDIWTLGRVPGVRRVLASVAAGADRRYADGLRLAEEAGALVGRDFEFLPSTRSLDRLGERSFAELPPYKLLFLGRWHANKGVDLLLDALCLLSDADWSLIARVRIAGGGPMDGQVRAGVATLQSAGRPVEIQDFLDSEAAQVALAGADFLLIPSRIESIPLVFSDAMKAGLPVVATPVGDLPGLVEGAGPCGVMAKAATAPAFAAALSKALAQSPSVYASGILAMRERFDLVGIANRIVEGIRRD